MRFWSFALGCAALCIAASTSAQTAPDARKSVQLSKVILDTTSREIKGKLKGGTLCVFPSKIDAIFPKDKKSQDYERYDTLFSEKMKSAGFRTLTTSGDLFAGEDDKNKADLLIGAMVYPDTLNICSSVNGEKGNVTLSVDWQLYDRATGKVVETLSTTGEGVQDKFSRDGLAGMWNRAFLVSLDGLIAQGVVQRYAGAPRPPAATANGAVLKP